MISKVEIYDTLMYLTNVRTHVYIYVCVIRDELKRTSIPFCDLVLIKGDIALNSDRERIVTGTIRAFSTFKLQGA